MSKADEDHQAAFHAKYGKGGTHSGPAHWTPEDRRKYDEIMKAGPARPVVQVSGGASKEAEVNRYRAVLEAWLAMWVTKSGTLIMGAPIDLMRRTEAALAGRDA